MSVVSTGLITVELGVVIGDICKGVSAKDASSRIAGYCLALDMTARNYQEDAKKQGLPWTLAKGCDTFTPLGKFIDKSNVPDPHNLRLTFKIDGKVKQDGSTGDMIFTIPQIIEYVSSFMTLSRGDIILTVIEYSFRGHSCRSRTSFRWPNC